MEKQIITFSANEQRLIKTGGIECYASNIVSYIEAHFDLGTNWSGYDSVRAVWSNDNNMTVISTVLDADGVCIVPFEVLKTKGVVKVNLVGSISVSDVLTDRLTTFPCEAVKVTAKAKIDGSETQPITPSQFEQFVAAVISEVEKVTGMTAQAETLPAGSQATARYENGILYLGIPQGIQGERGETGADGNGIASVVYNADYSLTLVFDNGERFTTPPIRGERGPAGADGRDGTDGRDGADGVTPSLSVGTVTTLPSTEDAYVTRTGTDENPVFNFGIPQGPKGDKGDPGEVSLDELSALLPTDTASGSIASFPDGTDLFPALSVKAQIEPIQSGSGTPSPDNVRPISGHTECVTETNSGNFWDEEWELGIIDTNSGEPTSATNRIRSKNFMSVVGGASYYFYIGTMVGESASKAIAFWYDANEAYLGYNNCNNVAATSPSNARYVKFYCASNYGTSYNHDISINYPSTDHEYHAYDGNTYTTALGRTVYGGTLDVVSGELVVDRAMVTLDGSDHAFFNEVSQGTTADGNLYIAYIANSRSGIKPDSVALSNSYEWVDANTTSLHRGQFNTVGSYTRFVIADQTLDTLAKWDAWLASNPMQLCYELATPQTYQLTPQEVQTLLGDNNIWSYGTVEVVYKADIQRWVLKKLSE